MKQIVYGKNVVNTLRREHPKLIKKIFLTKDIFHEKEAEFKSFIVEIWPEKKFNTWFGFKKHQKMAAEISHFPLFSFDDLLIDIKNKTSPQIILILDSIHDPQNVGAIIRSACATGVDAIIIAKTGQAPINSTIAKTSAGTLFAVKIVLVSNLHQAVLKLKKQNFWIISTQMHGETSYDQLVIQDLNVALIVGNEGTGVSSLLHRASDFRVYLPMINTESLNVNAATAVLLYEIRKKQNFWNKSK